MKRVVITGMGTVNALGHDVPQTLAALHAGKIGIKPITKFDASDTGIHVAGEIRDFDPLQRIEKKRVKRLDLFTQYALYSAIEAAEQAGLGAAAQVASVVDPARLAVIYGSGIGGLTTIQEQVTKLNAKGAKRVSPMFVPMAIINMAPGVLAQHFGAHGTSYAVVTACASGTSAIGQALQLIRSGAADIVITGGAEASLNHIGIAGFGALTALSPATDPLQASLPFGQHRSGFVLGEGAGTLILEDYAHALARHATILGEVAGYGSTSDAYHMTAPEPTGTQAAAAMRQALADADWSTQSVGYVNAHGTGTQANDAMESRAIQAVFGDAQVLVSSTKAQTGHLLGAAGALEAMLTVAAMRAGQLPLNAAADGQAEDCPVALVTTTNRQRATRRALSNSFGFGGHNAVLALTAEEPV